MSIMNPMPTDKSLSSNSTPPLVKPRTAGLSETGTGVNPLYQNHISLWLAFEYIILFIALYVSTISLGGIASQAIDQFVPDNTNLTNIYGLSEVNQVMLRGYVAAIIVFYPIFSLLFMHLKKLELTNPQLKNIRTRKVSIYITLIITFLITALSITSTLYGFLAGTTTSNSLLHFIATLFISGGVFVYYLLEVKEDRKIHA